MSIAYQEVAKHNHSQSCWIVLYGKVYDVTDYVLKHPGGAQAILQYAGKPDATEDFDPIHPSGTLKANLQPSACLGSIDTTSLPAKVEDSFKQDNHEGHFPLDALLNLDDIEEEATKRLSPKAWAYYFSAADDLISKTYNNRVYQSIFVRPRIFIDCTRCDLDTTFLGHPTKLPIFVSPAAMGRLAHKSGEKGIAAACAGFGAVQMISNNASMTPEQIVADAAPGQIFGWQLYVQIDRSKSEAMLARIAKLPAIKFITLTLDAPVPGKREHDERSKNVAANLPISSAIKEAIAVNQSPSDTSQGRVDAEKEKGGLGKFLFAGTAADLTWKSTLSWLGKNTHLPIILKGIQTHEDAYLASLHTPQIKGILLSNHGGRGLDTAPPAVHTLLEIRRYCPEVFDKLDVFVDGGIRRGTDIVKALCLGARGVGIGRAALYGLTLDGQAGVERVFEILKAETETCMRLLGVQTVDQLGMSHINARAVERDIFETSSNLKEVKRHAKL